MELTLFLIVGAIAIVAAALMLISENAIYSALFLILNFACIAFLFLMLHAPFLAMVQITVYAGAIMVLFLFVIMLLGAERVVPTIQPRFRWLAPVVVALALVFLLIASVAVINGNIATTEPRKALPYVRMVHVLDGVGPLDFYLDEELVANDLAFGQASEFQSWRDGDFQLRAVRAGQDVRSAKPVLDEHVALEKGKAYSLTAAGRLGESSLRLVAAAHTLDYSTKKDGLRAVVVNALPDRLRVDLRDMDANEVLSGAIGYGEAREIELSKGKRSVGLYLTGSQRTAVAELPGQNLEANTLVLWVFAEQRQPDNSFTDVIVNLSTDATTTFGSPTHIGRLLLSEYVLPFQLVALLLLIAMIGAIVLTHEALAPRPRMVRRLANPPAAVISQSAPGEPSK